MNKKLLIRVSLLASALLCGTLFVSAYTTIDGVTNDRNIVPIKAIVSPSMCLDLKSDNLRYGSSDRTTNGEVSRLQSFLVSNSLLKTRAFGTFGPTTLASVRQYQKINGISASGYVGTLTKQKIKEQTCKVSDDAQEINPLNTYTPPKSTSTLGSVCSYPAPPYGCTYVRGENFNPRTQCGLKLDCSGFGGRDVGTTTPLKPVACTMEARMCPDGSMMPRDPATCKWLESRCQGVGQSSLPPKQNDVRPGVISQEEQQRIYVCEKRKMACDNLSTNYNGFACKELTQLCEKFSASKNTDTIEINPQNVFPIKKVMATSSLPRGCGTMEIRYCPNGAMMKRDMATCKWIESSCIATSTLKVIPFPGEIACTDVVRYCLTGTKPNPNDLCPCIVGGNSYDQKPQQIQVKPVVCTMEARLCPNGVMMERDAQTCAWLTASCTASSTKLQPDYRYGYDPLPPVRPIASGSPFIPKGVACTMQVRLCPNGAVMPRDANCGWHPEQCPSGDGTTGGIQCSTDPFSGKPFCGPSQERPATY